MEHLDHIGPFADEIGITLTSNQLETLENYAEWLVSEARRAGGIGPNEVKHVIDRHLLDSLAFVVPLLDVPETLIDIGSGVGLPGIPIAIALPTVEITLIDRSGRRCALLKRAIRVLGLGNVDVRRAEVSEVEPTFDVATSRASLAPAALLPHVRRLAHLAVVAGSTVAEPRIDGYEAMKIESRYLDSPRWLLIMRSS